MSQNHASPHDAGSLTPTYKAYAPPPTQEELHYNEHDADGASAPEVVPAGGMSAYDAGGGGIGGGRATPPPRIHTPAQVYSPDRIGNGSTVSPQSGSEAPQSTGEVAGSPVYPPHAHAHDQSQQQQHQEYYAKPPIHEQAPNKFAHAPGQPNYYGVPNQNPYGPGQGPGPGGAFPLYTLNRFSVPVVCPLCGATEMTKIEHKAGGTADVAAVILFLFACLCCIPYLTTWFKDVQHHCGRCNALLAVWRRSGHTEVMVRNANGTPLGPMGV